jgi:hypothetical protein
VAAGDACPSYGARGGHGTTPATVVPRPVAGTISTRPPTVSIRSLRPVSPAAGVTRGSKLQPVSWTLNLQLTRFASQPDGYGGAGAGVLGGVLDRLEAAEDGPL